MLTPEQSSEEFFRLKGRVPWNKGKIGKTIKDLTGRHFGRLIVLEYAGRYVSDNGQGRLSLWECRCDCGRIKTIQRPALISGLVVSCGCFNKENARQLGLSNIGERNGMFYRRGILNPHYNFNLTIEDRLDHRNGTENIAWGKTILKRDNYTCQICLKRGGKLHAHHKESFALHREKRFDLFNGITLCKNCHISFHKVYGNECTTTDFIDFQKAHGLIASA